MAAVLGEPLLVDDPMLTTAQVATLLGVNQSTVQRMTRRGLLPVQGQGRWRYRLSDLRRVEIPPRPAGDQRARGPWVAPAGRVTLAEAARIVGMPVTTLRTSYLGTPDLPRLNGARHVVRRADAEELARRVADRLTVREAAARLGWTIAGVRQLLRDRVLPRHPDWDRPILAHRVQQLLGGGWTPPTDPVHEGRVPAVEAARLLGVSRDRATQRAREGRVPAVKDARGAWWFRPEHLEAIVQARRCEEAGRPSLPGAEPSGTPALD